MRRLPITILATIGWISLGVINPWLNPAHNFLAGGIPIRGNYPWSMILCKFYDVTEEPKPTSFFQKWIFDEEHLGSVASFFHNVSNGMYTIKGSRVHGWFTMEYRKQAIHYLADNDTKLNELYDVKAHQLRYYHKTKELCLETARLNEVALYQNTIVIINDENMAMFCTEEGILLSPNYYATSALAHEMVHSFHVGHSYSNRYVRIYPYAAIGEYDDVYDLMSTANAFMFKSDYGFTGPGLIGPHLDYLGWLPINRVLYFGLRNEVEATLSLASLSVPHKATEGWLMVLLPYDRDDPQNVYAIEFRTRFGVDSGLRRNAILIHKVKKAKEDHIFSYLITNDVAQRHEWLPGDTWTVFLSQNRSSLIQMSIKYIDLSRNIARIRIRSTFDPSACNSTELPRNATPTDNVCITVDEKYIIDATTRDAHRFTAKDNKTCLPGYVYRLADKNDQACVPQTIRDKVIEQDARFNQFLATFNLLKTWGLNACLPGYVWREIDMHDYVCVSPQDQQLALAQTRRACGAKMVPRKAFPSDGACVTQAELEASEKSSWNGRLKYRYRKFLNGVDTIVS